MDPQESARRVGGVRELDGRGILERGTEFERAVASMQMATPEECLRLDYMLPETESPLDWRLVRTEGIAPTGEVVPCVRGEDGRRVRGPRAARHIRPGFRASAGAMSFVPPESRFRCMRCWVARGRSA